MSAPIPPAKPRASLDTVINAARKEWHAVHSTPLPDFFVLAVRAYYRDAMGKPGVNDTGMYDDAFFIVSPLGFHAYNGNTDPSRYGWNPNAEGYMARLKPGCYTFVPLIHRGKYPAFGQGDNEVTIERIKEDGSVAKTITGTFGINNHKGGINGTSSEGCLTVPLEQWDEYHATLRGTIRKLGETNFPFILTTGPIV